MSAVLEALAPLWQVFLARPAPALAPDLPPAPSPAQRLLQTLQRAVTYSVVVEYDAPRGAPPVPIGVIVLCPGMDYAKAWFDLSRVAKVLLPRSRRWKRLHSYAHNLSKFPPQTLEALEGHIRTELMQELPSHRVLRFRPIEASIENPYRLTTKLYGEVVMKESVILEEAKEAMEEAIEELTCPKCGDEHPRSLSCRRTLHWMIQRSLDRMDEDECLYWMEQVNEKLPVTRQQLVVKLLTRFFLLFSQGHPEQAGKIQRFMDMAQEILSV